MEKLHVHSTVKVKNTQYEGTIKFVESASYNNPTHYYIELNKGMRHPDEKLFETSHQGTWTLIRVPVDQVEYRNPIINKDIYKLIDEKDLDGIKKLSDKSLNKKPTTRHQKEMGNPFIYAMMFGNTDIVLYLIERGLKYSNSISSNLNRSDGPYTPFNVLIHSSSIVKYEDLKIVWEKLVEQGYKEFLNQDAKIWGPISTTYSLVNNHKDPIAKINIINEKTDLFKSNSFENIKSRIEMLRAAMYNGKIELAKHLITFGINPDDSFQLIKKLGRNCEDYCKNELKRKNCSLEQLQELYQLHKK